MLEAEGLTIDILVNNAGFGITGEFHDMGACEVSGDDSGEYCFAGGVNSGALAGHAREALGQYCDGWFGECFYVDGAFCGLQRNQGFCPQFWRGSG